MSKKYFTVKEANLLVPDLLKSIPRLQELFAHMKQDFPDVRGAWDKARYNGGSEQGAGYLTLALVANRMLNDLDSRGCVLKGIEHGLVDFPSIRDGREVLLCWKNPEKEIQYWHDLDTGFAGRQPI